MCNSEWDVVWQYFSLDKKKYCLACETDLSEQDRGRGGFKRLKQIRPIN